MSEKIVVSPQKLHDSSEEIRGMSIALEGKYRAILDPIKALKAHWTGEAQEAMANRVLNYESDFDSLRKLLETYSQYLEATSRNYANAETKILETLQNKRLIV